MLTREVEQMTERKLGVTLYPSLYSRLGVEVELTWPDLVSEFSTHRVVTKKDEAPGWGPYRLTGRACGRSEHPTGPHRCDALVDAVELAVFDVDCGTEDDVELCDRLLEGHARLWYTSYSYRPDAERPALRLVVPLLAPVPSTRWASFRQLFIRTFRVPADLAKCGGLSHFYYAPSCPPDADPITDAHAGTFFDPRTLPTTSRTPTFHRPDDTPEDTDTPPTPERLEALGETLRKALGRFASSPVPETRARADVLRALLDHEPLAEHGSRNATTTRAAFDLVRLLPDASPTEIRTLLAPSVEAMLRAGSSLTPQAVAKMVASARTKVRAAREREAELEAFLRRHLNQVR